MNIILSFMGFWGFGALFHDAIARCVLWPVAARSQSPLCMLPFLWVFFWATRGPLEAESSPKRDVRARRFTRCDANIILGTRKHRRVVKPRQQLSPQHTSIACIWRVNGKYNAEAPAWGEAQVSISDLIMAQSRSKRNHARPHAQDLTAVTIWEEVTRSWPLLDTLICQNTRLLWPHGRQL